MRTRANECLLIVHSYRSVVYTLQERCAHPATTVAASKTRAETVQGLQCAASCSHSHTYRKVGSNQPLAIAYISKRRYATSAKTQKCKQKRKKQKTHKPRARRPSPTAVVFRYTICGRALLRYSNVAARNTRRSVSQPVYTRRSHASEDACFVMRGAM